MTTSTPAAPTRDGIEQAIAILRALGEADVRPLGHGELLAQQDAVALLVRLGSALSARYAGEVARRSTAELPEGGLARRRGFRRPEDLIKNVTGGTAAGARDLLDAGDALTPVDTPDTGDGAAGSAADGEQADATACKFPLLARVVMDGSMPVESAAHVSRGLKKVCYRLSTEGLIALERKLVQRALSLDPLRVRRLVEHAIAMIDVDELKAREERQREEQFVSWRNETDGMVTITARLDPVSAAPVKNVLEQVVTQGFRERRDQDPHAQDRRNVGQMRADALVWLARHAIDCDGTKSSGIKTTIVVRMSLEDLRSGSGLGSIDGMSQPVSVERLRQEAADAQVIPMVLGGKSEVLDLGRAQRLFSSPQRRALLERDGGCAKCHAPPEYCEAHHIRWWEEHLGRTDLSNGVMLCTRCHHDVHRDGWGIEVRDGAVWFTLPGVQGTPSAQSGPRVQGGAPGTSGVQSAQGVRERGTWRGGRAAIELSPDEAELILAGIPAV